MMHVYALILHDLTRQLLDKRKACSLNVNPIVDLFKIAKRVFQIYFRTTAIPIFEIK